MNKLSKTLAVLITALVFVTCGNASNGISGTYANMDGTMSIKFESGKAYYTTLMGSTIEMPYSMDGDKILLGMPGGVNMVLTRNKDGSLSGFPGGGDLKKTVSSDLADSSHLSGDYGIMHENVWYTMFTIHGSTIEIGSAVTGGPPETGTYEIKGHKVYITAKDDAGNDETDAFEIDDKGCLVIPRPPDAPKSAEMPHLCKRP